MPVHIVEQGECMALIARRHGFADSAAIYGEAANADLRAARSSPNVLEPGDEVLVPERRPKRVECATERLHAFRVKLPMRSLELILHDSRGEPIVGAAYVLSYESHGRERRVDGTTTAAGAVKHALPADVIQVTLTMRGRKRDVLLGHLNPLRRTSDDGVSGVQARLANLGYPTDGVTGELSARTLRAVRAFRRDAGIDEDGGIDDAFLRELERRHGC
jgi:hypothetical protein